MSDQFFSFVIVGAQKSASSFLHLCLADHPGLFMPPGELAFFEDPDYDAVEYPSFCQHFLERNGRIAGFRRVSYMGLLSPVSRIQRHAPSARIIAILRNPVDRAISSYYHNMANGFLPLLNPEKGLRHLLDGGWENRYPRSYEVMEFSHYNRQLQHIDSLFPHEQVLVLLHDDLVADPIHAVRTAYAFLGVDPSFTPPALTRRPQAALYNMTRLALRRAMNPVKYRYNPGRTRLEKQRLTRWGRAWISAIETVDAWLVKSGCESRKPTLSSALRADLAARFESDVECVERRLGRALPAWRT